MKFISNFEGSMVSLNVSSGSKSFERALNEDYSFSPLNTANLSISIAISEW